jgi:DNA-binding transcriptional LysR family regulator
MPRISRWDNVIGRRLRLRDLFVFFTVLECGSMSKAASRLGVSTPSVSELIADLEHAVGARLLDRSPRGVVATRFGEALLARGLAAFDELRQGIQDIESIADPSGGEVRVGCPESATAFLAAVIEHLCVRHPRMRFVVKQAYAPYPGLMERKIDLALSRIATPQERGLGDDLKIEVLFDDPFSAVVSAKSPLARRRRIDLAELCDECWIVPPADAIGGVYLDDAFRQRGLPPPTPSITTLSIHLRNDLASRGRYIAVLPRSVLRFSMPRYGLKELPLKLSSRPSPVGMVTLRNRSLTPAVHAFMQSAREVGKLFSGTKANPSL